MALPMESRRRLVLVLVKLLDIRVERMTPAADYLGSASFEFAYVCVLVQTIHFLACIHCTLTNCTVVESFLP